MGDVLPFQRARAREVPARPCNWWRRHRWTQWDAPRMRGIRYNHGYSWWPERVLMQERRCARCGVFEHRVCGTAEPELKRWYVDDLSMT